MAGVTEHNPSRASQPIHVSEYKQNFVFDEAGLGRMMNKASSETTLTGSRNGDDLNYAIDYVYAKGFAHRLERAGNRFYKYDANGNVTQEEYDGLSESDSREVTVTDYGNDVYGVDSAWGYFETDNATTKVKQERHYRRTYVWDVRNRLTESHDSTNDVYYIYGEDGIRTNKYTREAETIYFNNFWTWHKDGSSELDGGKNSKHIFLGSERLVTKVNSANRPSYSEECGSQYFYHSDHLGSAQLVTNHKGEVYQRIEYTPYGETWIDMQTNTTALYDVPYRFTAKELDKETGLYYYGARYLDPKYSRWISTDPALGEYIPAAGKANLKDMANLPGMGGIFNHTNAGLFHYAANNPVRYIDPDGRLHGLPPEIQKRLDNHKKLNELRVIAKQIKATDMAGDKCINFKPEGASDDGCFARASLIAEHLREKGFKVNYAIVNHPKWANNGKVIEYYFHIAACVELGDENYVVDPMLNCEGPYSGLSKFAAWRDFQKPMNDYQKYGIPDTGLYTGYDTNGIPIENRFIQKFYKKYNKNPSLTVPEYAEGWIEHFIKTRDTKYDGF